MLIRMLLRECDIEERTFTSIDVCQICRVSYRQLDYWVRTGRVSNSARVVDIGYGMRRQWSFEDLFVVEVIGRLRRANFDFGLIDSVVATIREVPGLAHVEAHTMDPTVSVTINLAQIVNELEERLAAC